MLVSLFHVFLFARETLASLQFFTSCPEVLWLDGSTCPIFEYVAPFFRLFFPMSLNFRAPAVEGSLNVTQISFRQSPFKIHMTLFPFLIPPKAQE